MANLPSEIPASSYGCAWPYLIDVQRCVGAQLVAGNIGPSQSSDRSLLPETPCCQGDSGVQETIIYNPVGSCCAMITRVADGRPNHFIALMEIKAVASAE